jgi:hypothetical protein
MPDSTIRPEDTKTLCTTTGFGGAASGVLLQDLFIACLGSLTRLPDSFGEVDNA